MNTNTNATETPETLVSSPITNAVSDLINAGKPVSNKQALTEHPNYSAFIKRAPMQSLPDLSSKDNKGNPVATAIITPQLDAEAVAQVTAYNQRYANGHSFAADELAQIQSYASKFQAESEVALNAAVIAFGEKGKALTPFVEWAESLNVDKLAAIKLTSKNGVQISFPSDGVLRESLFVAIRQLARGKEFNGFNAKLASKTNRTEVNGESELIRAEGIVQVIGEDKTGYMQRLVKNIAAATTRLESGQTDAAARLIFSQVSFTAIEFEHFANLVQGIIYGRYAAAAKAFADSCAIIAKKAVRQEVAERATAPKQTRKAAHAA